MDEVSVELDVINNSAHENSVTPNSLNNIEVDNESYLLSGLAKKNADIQSLLEEWWTKYETCSFDGLKEILEVLFHSTGWVNFTFDNRGLDEIHIGQHVKLKESIPSSLEQLSLNEIFIDRFSHFLNKLFECNDNQLLLTESFISPLITSCTLLISGSWTSYRMIAAVAGMKIMTSLQILHEEILYELKSPTISDAKIDELNGRKAFIFQMWFKLFMKVFKFSIRDVISEVRRVSITEMVLWAIKNPSLLFGKRWQKYIYLGIRDKNSNNRELAFKMVYYLFKNEIDVEKQVELFNYLKIELLLAIQALGGITAELSISICTDIINYTQINLSVEERSFIYICVYCESQLVAVRAAKFLMVQLQAMADSPIGLIKCIIRFNEEAKQQAENLLMDALYYYIRPVLKWEHWFNYISFCRDENTVPIIAMFFAYVLKAVTGYSPSSRITHKSLQLKKNVMADDQRKLDKCLALFWVKLIRMDKIVRRPEAHVRMIKVLQYCTPLYHTSQNILEMCKELSYIISTNEENNIVCESCKSLKHLLTSSDAKDKATFIPSIIDELVNNVTSEFTEYLSVPSCTLFPLQIHNRIVYLCQSINFDDQIIWEKSRINLLSYSTNNYYEELLITLMKILHLRLCYHIKLLLDQKGISGHITVFIKDNETSVEDNDTSMEYNLERDFNLASNSKVIANPTNKSALITKINQRAKELLELMIIFLNHSSYSVKITAFRIMGIFIEYLGPHMKHHSSFKDIYQELDSDVITLMQKIAVQAFQEECFYKSKSVSSKAKVDENCCIVVERFSKLLQEGIIDWLNSTKLILHINKHQGHADMVANAMKAFLTKFPRQYRKPTLAIFNAIATVVKFKLEEDVPELQAVESTKYILDWIFTPNGNFSSLYPVLLYLHQLLITEACRNMGIKSFMKLLYHLAPFLKNEDVPYISQIFNNYKEDQNYGIEAYTTFIERRIQ